MKTPMLIFLLAITKAKDSAVQITIHSIYGMLIVANLVFGLYAFRSISHSQAERFHANAAEPQRGVALPLEAS